MVGDSEYMSAACSAYLKDACKAGKLVAEMDVLTVG